MSQPKKHLRSIVLIGAMVTSLQACQRPSQEMPGTQTFETAADQHMQSQQSQQSQQSPAASSASAVKAYHRFLSEPPQLERDFGDIELAIKANDAEFFKALFQRWENPWNPHLYRILNQCVELSSPECFAAIVSNCKDNGQDLSSRELVRTIINHVDVRYLQAYLDSPLRPVGRQLGILDALPLFNHARRRFRVRFLEKQPQLITWGSGADKGLYMLSKTDGDLEQLLELVSSEMPESERDLEFIRAALLIIENEDDSELSRKQILRFIQAVSAPARAKALITNYPPRLLTCMRTLPIDVDTLGIPILKTLVRQDPTLLNDLLRTHSIDDRQLREFWPVMVTLVAHGTLDLNSLQPFVSSMRDLEYEPILLNDKTKDAGPNALGYACSQFNAELVDWLNQNGHIRLSSGLHPSAQLFFAMTCRDRELLENVLKSNPVGLKSALSGNAGVTRWDPVTKMHEKVFFEPVKIVCIQRDWGALQLLIQAGADKSQLANMGFRCLTNLVQDRVDIFSNLLEEGLKIDVVTLGKIAAETDDFFLLFGSNQATRELVDKHSFRLLTEIISNNDLRNFEPALQHVRGRLTSAASLTNFEFPVSWEVMAGREARDAHDHLCAAAVRRPNMLRRLLVEGIAFSARDLQTAIEIDKPESVRILLHLPSLANAGVEDLKIAYQLASQNDGTVSTEFLWNEGLGFRADDATKLEIQRFLQP